MGDAEVSDLLESLNDVLCVNLCVFGCVFFCGHFFGNLDIDHLDNGLASFVPPFEQVHFLTIIADPPLVNSETLVVGTFDQGVIGVILAQESQVRFVRNVQEGVWLVQKGVLDWAEILFQAHL